MPVRTFILSALVLGASAVPAFAQEAEIKMEGRCEKLVIADQDITQNCKERLVNTVARNRTSFDFAAWDGQTLSFSGVGGQREATEVTDANQLISLVVSGRKEKDAIIRNPAPAVGSCRFTNDVPGKTTITCEATSQGKAFAGVFVTDAKSQEPKQDGAKP